MASKQKVANVERRTWDKEAYEARAKARTAATEAVSAVASSAGVIPRPALSSSAAQDEEGTSNKRPLLPEEEPEKEEFVPAVSGTAGPERSRRAFLKARKNRVDLDSKVGSSEIISPDAVATTGGPGPSEDVKITDGVTKSSTGVGWHCKVCDCYLKDSLTYLDHINGRKHQRYLGYSMRVEKVSAKEVTGKLAELAEAKRAVKGANGALASSRGSAGGDGGDTNEFEDMVRKKDEEALRRKAERARKREERKRREQEEAEEEEVGMDPDIAAMMGFGGFGGGHKNG
eukprot:CAMPEP_0113562674 /NCGR_PEP_ID=MMETSP0015_2-20120614/20653_1 /TAXON_ID=2838 /ORGANISM="Odontella" /LENGTH=286 /DNA_ID=CAMNT_0000464587 /DNA_START=111 /DNA_END=971 /DNA_ORIENTATION=+ /assembly_acc=CAM_ASM_000160